jgi:hypothetical protein
VNEATMPQHRRPLWLAALVTSVAVPIGYFLLVLAASALRNEAPGDGTARAFGYTMMFGLPVTAGAMFLLGMPVVLMLRSMNSLRALHVCIGAAVAGGLALSLLFAMTGGNDHGLSFVWGGLVGLFAGVVFCAVAGVRWRELRR